MSTKLEMINHVLIQVRKYSSNLLDSDLFVMSQTLEELINNYVLRKYHIDITEE